jgi:DNA-binding CsgD family transcriptional regulator
MISAGAATLSTHDVRALLRLSAEVHELGHDPAVWRRHLLTELGRLCGGSTGMAFEHWTPRGTTIEHLNQKWDKFAFADAPAAPTVRAVFNAQTIDVGFESESAYQRYEELCYKRFAISDPAWPALNGLVRRFGLPEGLTVASHEVVDAGTWARSSFIQENMRICDAGPYLKSIYFLPAAQGILGLNLQRPWGDKPFSPREVALVDLVHGEIVRSLREGPLAAAAGLPRRQRQTLDLLLEGKREKEVADGLGLALGTTHDYVKKLYRRLGVSSRAELSALFLDAGRRAGPQLVGPAPLPASPSPPGRAGRTRKGLTRELDQPIAPSPTGRATRPESAARPRGGPRARRGRPRGRNESRATECRTPTTPA